MSNNDPAVNSFLINLGRIRKQLNMLGEQANDHFGVVPDHVDYGHVGSTNYMISALGDALAHWGLPRNGEKND